MKRTIAQIAWFLATNLHLTGFVDGRIFRGPTKSVCVPGLNCYSCPGALGACPIGALQAVIGGIKYQFSFYVVGTLVLFGTALGRFICGWLCPFGLVQDLIAKIRKKKAVIPPRLDRPLRYTKYAVLAVLVILLPMTLTTFGLAPPYFCQYVCPSGTLFGGVPLLLAEANLRSAVGWLFGWKSLLLIAALASSVVLYRPFCKYLCPLGAIYALFNRVSAVRMTVDEHKCVHCGKCANACPMQVPVPKKPNHPECIRCGVCKQVCPTSAIRTTTPFARGDAAETKAEQA